METINNRIRLLRNSLGLSQTDFAVKLGCGRGVIKNIEELRTEMRPEFVDLVCQIYGVSENWLRTGEGEMFPKKSEDPLWGMLGKVLKEEKSSFKRQLITALCQLEPNELAAVEKVIDKFLAEREKAKE